MNQMLIIQFAYIDAYAEVVMSCLGPSDFTVAEFLKMLEEMPQDAHVYLTYKGYYDGSGGIDKPYIDKKGRVVVGEVKANY